MLGLRSLDGAAEGAALARSRPAFGHFVFIALCICALALGLLYLSGTLEDAHITMRYARNMADGFGLGAWNPGAPPVEGFSSLLWTVILGYGMKAGLSPFALSKSIGLASLASIIGIHWKCFAAAATNRFSSGVDRQAFLVAAMIVALYLPVSWYAVSGMEAIFFAAQINALLLAPIYLSNLAALATVCLVLPISIVLTRPEGALLAPLICAFHVVVGNPGRSRIVLAIGLICALAALAGLEWYRLATFGYPAPNTYYAKATGNLYHSWLGIRYCLGFAAYTAPLWLLGLLGVRSRLRSRRQEPALFYFLIIVAGIYVAYVVKVGGDPTNAFPMWRHFLHIVPFWTLLVAILICHAFKGMKARVLATAVAMVAVDAVLLAGFPGHLYLGPVGRIATGGVSPYEEPNAYFTWVDRFADSRTVTATSLAGQWGWYVPGTNIDTFGLNDSHIAHDGVTETKGPVDSKSDMTYVLARKPDLIDGGFSGADLAAGRCHTYMLQLRPKMFRAMFGDPSFRDDYLFVTNAPYAAMDRALFMRKAFFDQHHPAGVQVTPVSETALYVPGCQF